VKNNKIKMEYGENSISGQLYKFMRGLVNKRQLPHCEALRCTLDDIRSVDTRGKWWVVGAPWVGRQHSAEESVSQQPSKTGSVAAKAPEPRSSVDGQDGRIERIARAMNINTDIRRSIFNLLLTSDD